MIIANYKRGFKMEQIKIVDVDKSDIEIAKLELRVKELEKFISDKLCEHPELLDQIQHQQEMIKELEHIKLRFIKDFESEDTSCNHSYLRSKQYFDKKESCNK